MPFIYFFLGIIWLKFSDYMTGAFGKGLFLIGQSHSNMEIFLILIGMGFVFIAWMVVSFITFLLLGGAKWIMDGSKKRV
jgi:hypothetical protein